AALKAIREQNPTLIIDDFHYLSRKFQGDIVRALKPLIFDGLAVVAIAIPHRRFDAIKVEKEMTQRIQPIPVPSWSKEELMEIASIGFPLLNAETTAEVNEKMALESYGSPHLMQEFCSELARKNGIEKTLKDEI